MIGISHKRAELSEFHPCFGAAGNRARVHLPICPSCNIECAFCRRSLDSGERRPGVSAFILPVEKVESYVGAALEKCGALSVVGVAGPGDSLVGDNLFRSFEIVGRKYPRLLKCASTNGLLLPSRAKELLKVGVDTLTVTVNAVDPGVLAKIVLRVRCDGREYEGREGAEILIENQLAGIRKMTSAGVAVKVNTVLIPGVNDHHVADVARAAGEAGAALFNIIPLIPQHRMADLPAPGCGELEAARRQAGAYIDVFRHCQHCRADAFGIPGVSELSGALGPGRAEEVFSHG